MTPHDLHKEIDTRYVSKKNKLSGISNSIVNDAARFIHYDKVVEEIFGKTNSPCSPDMYDFLGNNFVFTEFKNIQGAWGCDQKMAPIIRQTKNKIYEGVGWVFSP